AHVESLLRNLLPDRDDQAAFKGLFAKLYRRQPDGSVTTELILEERLEKQWAGGMEFKEMLTVASHGSWRLLRVSRVAGGRGDSSYRSLGHDALATVAQEWDEQLGRWKRVQRWALAVAGVFAAAVVFAFLALFAWDAKTEAENQKTQLEVMLARTSLRPLSG